MLNKAINHLKQNQMTYREHLVFAVGHGLACLYAGIMLIIHGVLPCFFEHTGSELVQKLNLSFNNNKNKDS